MSERSLRFAGLAFGLAAFVALAGGCGSGSGAGAGGAGAGPVVRVTRGDLVYQSSTYGELEAAVAHPIFAPDLRGIWQITVETVLTDGTEVKKGDTVLTFARGTVDAVARDRNTELLVAEASRRKVEADYEDQRIARSLNLKRAELAVELARMNVVEGVNVVSRLELEKAKVELSRAELALSLARKEVEVLEQKRTAALEGERIQVEAARAKVADSQTELAKMVVVAPADGVLYAPYTRLNWMMSKVAPGKVVSPGDKLLEIPQLDRFKANIYVRQREAANIKVGDTALVVPAMFPEATVRGKVVTRDDFATTRNERTGTSTPAGTLKELRVVLELEPAAVPLRPGGTVRAELHSVLAKDVLLVPLTAVTEVPGGHRVTRTDGTVVTVALGQTSPTHAEVQSGLAEGDEVRLVEPATPEDPNTRKSPQ
jgi:HlyD family secretion protein